MQARFFLYSCCLEGQWSSISRQKKFQWNIKSSKSLTHLYHICLNGMYHNTLLAWTGQKLFKKMSEKQEHIFGTFEHSWAGLASNFLIHVRLPGGTAIIFTQSLNFELKFFVDHPLMQKITSTCVRSYFLSKNEPKEPKDCNPNIAHC